MLNTQHSLRTRYRLAGSASTACTTSRSVRPAVAERPVAWANSFSMPRLGNRGSIRPMAYTGLRRTTGGRGRGAVSGGGAGCTGRGRSVGGVVWVGTVRDSVIDILDGRV